MNWYIETFGKDTLEYCITDMRDRIVSIEYSDGDHDSNGAMIDTLEMRNDLKVFLYQYLKNHVAVKPMVRIAAEYLDRTDLRVLGKIHETNWKIIQLYLRDNK